MSTAALPAAARSLGCQRSRRTQSEVRRVRRVQPVCRSRRPVRSPVGRLHVMGHPSDLAAQGIGSVPGPAAHESALRKRPVQWARTHRLAGVEDPIHPGPGPASGQTRGGLRRGGGRSGRDCGDRLDGRAPRRSDRASRRAQGIRPHDSAGPGHRQERRMRCRPFAYQKYFISTKTILLVLLEGGQSPGPWGRDVSTRWRIAVVTDSPLAARARHPASTMVG